MEEVANKGNLAAIDEWVAPDCVEHEEIPPQAPSGREAVRFFFTQWREGFPDGQVTWEKLIAEDDLVVGYAVWQGMHRGEFMGMLPSGRRVTFHAIDIVRIADGKIVEHWGVADNLAWMQQIGAIPVPGQGGS
jgi:predicted ester cyclase